VYAKRDTREGRARHGDERRVGGEGARCSRVNRRLLESRAASRAVARANGRACDMHVRGSCARTIPGRSLKISERAILAGPPRAPMGAERSRLDDLVPEFALINESH